LSKPGWADATPQNLTPASGRQDHTILPSATTSLVSTPGNRSQVFRPALRSHRAQNAAASTATHPAFVTMANAPLVGWDAWSSRSDLGGVKTEIFFGKAEIRLDSPVKKPPDGQITTRQRVQIPLVASALRAGGPDVLINTAHTDRNVFFQRTQRIGGRPCDIEQLFRIKPRIIRHHRPAIGRHR
jgi:hypothetical protein